MESINAFFRNRFIAVLGITVLLLFTVTATFGQTFAEWFSQKKTQIKYLNQQIAALTQYGNYLKQGYVISKHGLGSVDSCLKDEFDFHSNYYTSLKQVNPVINSDSKADTIISYAKQIPFRFDNLINQSTIDAGSHDYIGQVRTAVTVDCDQDLAELHTITTNGKIQMSDDERIRRIDDIYRRMKDKYTFTLFFCGQARTLLLQRHQALRDINTLKLQYGNIN